MAAKITGISRDLIIHPGKTLGDILEVRGISQVELANSTGVSAAYISNVVAGKKNISAKFAQALEYALSIPKSFWLNLQANYDAELLEYNEAETITDDERQIIHILNPIIKYLKGKKTFHAMVEKCESVLMVRQVLRVSNLANLPNIVPQGAFRMEDSTKINPYVLGAWLRMCQLHSEQSSVTTKFDSGKIDELVCNLKDIMINHDGDLQKDLKELLANYGIDFFILKHFQGAPVQGYIKQEKDGTYQMFLTIRRSYADIFWFSLFHELGHIINGDVSKNNRFIDMDSNHECEKKADEFASKNLLSPEDYDTFLKTKDFSISAIERFAAQQNVMPYVVIGRLQKEKYLSYQQYSKYKLKYKWAS